MASASAVECTATVGMPSLAAGALHAQRDLAAVGDQDLSGTGRPRGRYSRISSGSPNSTGAPEAIRMRGDGAGLGRLDLVEGLHRLDQQQRLAGRRPSARRDERRRARLGGQIGDADHRAEHRAGMRAIVLGGRGDGGGGGRHGRGGSGQHGGRLRHDRGRRADHPDAVVLGLDLDLRQAGIGQDGCKRRARTLRRTAPTSGGLPRAGRPSRSAPACSRECQVRKSRRPPRSTHRNGGGISRAGGCW